MTTITISGTPGSGKTTVAELLKKKLNLKYVYSGLIFRDYAKKYNMSLEEFSKYCEKKPDIDKKLDQKQLEYLKKIDIIVEGRLAGWLAYKNDINALKVMLDTDVDIRARRVVKREQGNIEKKKKEMLKREESEAKRYKNYYNIDIKDKSIYDIVIDTGDKTPEDIVEMIIKKL